MKSSLLQHDILKDFISRARRSNLRSYEIPIGVLLIKEPFTVGKLLIIWRGVFNLYFIIENGLLTPS
jgi:hypothetical protein